MALVRLRRSPRPAEEEAADSIDVPAAVVCAMCGRGDCTGCGDESTASGMIAIVPWERGQVGWPTRFWSTVHATTRGAEGFFRALPDGQVGPALRFAVLAESFAVTSTVLAFTPLVVLGIPGLLQRFLTQGSTRESVALAALVAIVGFTALLLVAHAVLHGFSLGKRVSRSRALRLGLYACGWDFGSSPAGVVTAFVSGGFGGVRSLLASSISAPSRAVEAALDGIFKLHGREAQALKRRVVVVAMAVAVPAVVLVLAMVVATALFAVPG